MYFCFLSPADGWIKIIRGRCPPSEQWPRLQKKVAGSGGDFKSVKERWRSGAATAQRPHSGNSDGSSRSRGHLVAALARATRVSPSPDVVVAEARKKVFRLEKALEASGDSTGPEVDFYEAARERPLEVQIKECREFITFGAASREVGGRSTGRVGSVDRREVKIVTTGKSANGSALAARTRSDRIGTAHPSSCPRMRRVASCCHPSVASGKPIWCSERCPSLDNIPPVPDDVQDVEGWLSCRNCELRNALEFGAFQVGSSHRGCLHGTITPRWMRRHGSVNKGRAFRSLTLWTPWQSRGRGFKPRSQGEAQTSSCCVRHRA